MRTLPEIGGLKVTDEAVPFQAAGVTLAVELRVQDNHLLLKLEYHADRYSEAFIHTFAARYERILEELLKKERLSDIRMLDEAETEEMLALSRGEGLSYDVGETWLDLFKDWAGRLPERAAVTDSMGTFTYGELDRASDSIAAYLQAQGVQENSFVAVRMGRVKEFIAAVPGVQKVGAAYMPVDPAYPEDRIAYMIADCQAEVLLTEDVVADALAQLVEASINAAVRNHPALATVFEPDDASGMEVPDRSTATGGRAGLYIYEQDGSLTAVCFNGLSEMADSVASNIMSVLFGRSHLLSFFKN